jgi:putative phosphoribosyl transferase
MTSPAVTARPSFRNRHEAGKVLAQALSPFAARPDVVVLGLARGGMPVARAVADALGATLGVFVARKFAVPGVEEVALGAIAEGSRRIVVDEVARYIGVPARIIERLATRERVELERCASLYHAGSRLPDLRGRVVILVDDGLITGVTLRAAAHVVRRAAPARLIAAVPVASQWGSTHLGAAVDELTVAVTSAKLRTLSTAFEHCDPVTDEEVLELLHRPTRRVSSTMLDTSSHVGMALPWGDDRPRDRERAIAIPVADGAMMADLGMPTTGVFQSTLRRLGAVRGLVILAHEDGVSRNTFVNRYIAGRLRLGGYATLRLDLMMRSERLSRADSTLVGIDAQRLETRLAAACDWAVREGIAGVHRMTLVGAANAAGAAILTAARHRDRVRAVVVRGGPVDLAGHVLSQLRGSVLLIAGADDPRTVRRYAAALRELPADTQLMTVPRATHALDDPQAVGSLAERLMGWLDGLEQTDRRGRRRPSGA